MKTINTDFLIIGSGFGGAAPALRLCQAGHKVLMIERGANIRGKEDFKQSQDPKHLKQFLHSLSGKNISFTYAEALGGGSGFYEMVSLRAPTQAFEQNSPNGKLLWPGGLSRTDLDPFYDISESMLNVSQIAADKIPKSGIAFSMMMKNMGYSCDRARYAVKGCLGSGYCVSGCIFGAKQSLHYNYIPMAEKQGLEILPATEAEYIQVEKNGRDIQYKVICQNAELGAISIHAKRVILAAGTVGTAKILLKSKEFLPALSEETGKNICFNGSVKAAGMLPDEFIEGDMLSGMSHPGMISYHFLKSKGITISSAKPLPLVLLGSTQFNIKGEDKNSFWGKPNVELMKAYRRKMIVLYALGFAPQTAEIRHIKKNKFKAHLDITPELKAYYKSTKNTLDGIYEGNQCKVLELQKFTSSWKEKKGIGFITTHMTGSCRMAENEIEGVIDENCEVFGYPGLYVTGGAAIPSSLAVNTSLTILANAERAARIMVNKYK